MQCWEQIYRKGKEEEKIKSYWKMEYLESPEGGKFGVRKKSTIL